MVGHQWHPRCIVCGPDHRRGLGMRFVLLEDGSVECRWPGRAGLEGYPGQMHGGVIAMLLDGAMTNCLFAHGYAASTAELAIRYHRPVASSEALSVRAWIERVHPPLRVIASALEQDGVICSSATAKFLDRPILP
jgi:uncharacterized protein (TIGR00369 family)